MTENSEHVELCSMPDSPFPLSTSTAQCLTIHTCHQHSSSSCHQRMTKTHRVLASNSRHKGRKWPLPRQSADGSTKEQGSRLLVSYLIRQHRILLWTKHAVSENIVLRSLVTCCKGSLTVLLDAHDFCVHAIFSR